MPTSDKEGIIVGGRSCSSCWQVGHDVDCIPFPVGTIVYLPKVFGARQVWLWKPEHFEMAEELLTETDGNGNSFVFGNKIIPSWKWAAMQAGYSHNELVNDSEDPRPDSTLVLPSELALRNIQTEGG